MLESKAILEDKEALTPIIRIAKFYSLLYLGIYSILV